MSIKKKLGLGVASAALGLSLVGGGTWAAFNDVEVMNNSLAAGTLDLVIDNPTSGSFNVPKMVPGDTITRSFEIQNDGNVDINEVLLKINTDFSKGAKPQDRNGGTYVPVQNDDVDEFLKQFEVEVLTSDGTNLLNSVPTTTTTGAGTYKSLYDLVNHADGTFNIASGDGMDNKGVDFNNRDSDTITINLKFVEDNTKEANGREYVQNRYMNNSVGLEFVFEATQKPGTAR
ncbi:TasA family protein [Sutcliffiella horikoshii]|uniref:TasA family protein n=1 Tax=Sutcliffiella horikoshii TaxID=79883 RepID=UPI003CEE06D4